MGVMLMAMAMGLVPRQPYNLNIMKCTYQCRWLASTAIDKHQLSECVCLGKNCIILTETEAILEPDGCLAAWLPGWADEASNVPSPRVPPKPLLIKTYHDVPVVCLGLHSEKHSHSISCVYIFFATILIITLCVWRQRPGRAVPYERLMESYRAWLRPYISLS